MSYDYPKGPGFNSPPKKYDISQFPAKSPQNSPPKKSFALEKKTSIAVPSSKRSRLPTCFSFKYWKPFFDLSSRDFGKRILLALFPCSGDSFFVLIKEKPDLYGPFWIYATLIFTMAAAGNLYRYFNTMTYNNSYSSVNSTFTYNYKYIPYAFFIIFGYGLLAPFFLNLIFKLFEVERMVEKTFVQALCIYGYSTFVFIPISLLCMIPSTALQIVFMLIAALNSTGFLVYNYWRELKTIRNNNKWVILLLLVLGQLALFILFEVFFFSSVISNSGQTTNIVTINGNTAIVSNSNNSGGSSNSDSSSNSIQKSSHLMDNPQEALYQRFSTFYRCSN